MENADGERLEDRFRRQAGVQPSGAPGAQPRRALPREEGLDALVVVPVCADGGLAADGRAAFASPSVGQLRVLERRRGKLLIKRVLEKPLRWRREVGGVVRGVRDRFAVPEALEVELRSLRREEAHDLRD